MGVRRLPSGLLALVLLCASSSPAADANGGVFVPLREAREPAMQRALESSIRKLGLESLVRKRRLAVALAGITDPTCPRLASVNGDVMMYAASLPKIAILLGAFRRIDAGQMVLDAETEELLTAMIRTSSNPAASRMLQRVGRDYVLRLLQSPELGLYDRRHSGGLWVGKDYGPRPAFRRDPLHGISHGATALQVARFYYMLETGRLVSPESTVRMKAMLSDPGINHKFVAGLGEVHPYARLWRKSGTWRDYHADSAIVAHDGKRYVAVALTQNRSGEEILRRLIVELDEIIFSVPGGCPAETRARQRALPAALGAPPG